MLWVSVALATRIAVLDFQTHTVVDDLRPLGTGLASMMITDLARSPDLTLVERERLDAVLDELELQDKAVVDPQTRAEVGRLAGATALVTGSVTVVQETVRIDVRLVGMDAEIDHTASVEGPVSGFFGLQRQLSLALMDALGAEVRPADRRFLSAAPVAIEADLDAVARQEFRFRYARTARTWTGIGVTATALGALMVAGSFATGKTVRQMPRSGWTALQVTNVAGAGLAAAGVGVTIGNVIIRRERRYR